MNTTTAPTSSFLGDALAAMGSGRMVVVDGAVDDDVLLHGTAMPVTDALSRSWEDASGALVIRWTPADGLSTASAGRLQQLTALLRAPADASVQGGVHDSLLDRRDPLDVATTLGQLFAQDEARILVIAEHAGLMLTTSPDPYCRRVIAAMLHAIESFERATELHALVLLSRDLGDVAPAITRRTGVAQVRIAGHSVQARALIAGTAFNLPADDASIERLAITADGFALREIAKLATHARATGIALTQPRELTASFRHGHRTDPWAALSTARMAQIRAGIRTRVFGQESAVSEILDRLEVARSGLELDAPATGARKSRLELFLAGPTGVGKNELARALAGELFGDPGALMVFDMSAFQQEHSGEQLFGAPPGYVGHERGSPLVDRLRERPFTVIVFDEIEKAHPNNWLRLMAAIDEGRVADTRGVQASLENAVVIFTSNIGSDVVLERARHGPMSTDEVQQATLALVESHLSRNRYDTPAGDQRAGLGRPEVWGRLAGSVVAFDLLRPGAVAQIVERFCETLARSATRARKIELQIDIPSVTGAVTARLGAPGTWNGRLIKGHIDAMLRRPLAQALAGERFASAPRVTAGLTADGTLRVGIG